MSVAEIGRCSILGGMKHMQRGARMGMYGILNILCVGGNSILGACILHMQAGPAYACIPYLTYNKLM